jgi:hypothetical protein
MRTILHSMNVGAIAAALLTGLSGCGKKSTNDVGAVNRSNIQRLSNMYAAYQHYNGGHGPENEAQLRTFIAGFNQQSLESMKIDPDKLDSLFLSERDGKPFNIRYKVDGGHAAVIAVILEQEGKGGKRQVGYTGGKVEEVDDARYANLWADENVAPVDGATGGAPASDEKKVRNKATRPSGIPAGAPIGPPGG